MKLKLLLIFCAIANVLSAKQCEKPIKPSQPCEPCVRQRARSCCWSGGPQHWPNPIYDGSIQSAAAATLSDIGYPLQPRNLGIM